MCTTDSAKAVLRTRAVKTHLRWIQQLGQPNCFVAPEVWDYGRICELAKGGTPIADVMFSLSVIHHIDGVSQQQYEEAGMTALQGSTDLIAKMLLLSQRHFIELPNKPWITPLYDTHGTQRGILDACAKASGRAWRFRGPIYQSEWFGMRELWILEAEKPMPIVDVQASPFPLLYRGDEAELDDDYSGGMMLESRSAGIDDFSGGQDSIGNPASTYKLDQASRSGAADGMMYGGDRGGGYGGALSSLSGHPSRGHGPDPGYARPAAACHGPVDPHIGEALAAAPVELLRAHLALRDAVSEAQMLLEDFARVNQDFGAPPGGRGGGRPILQNA